MTINSTQREATKRADAAVNGSLLTTDNIGYWKRSQRRHIAETRGRKLSAAYESAKATAANNDNQSLSTMPRLKTVNHAQRTEHEKWLVGLSLRDVETAELYSAAVQKRTDRKPSKSVIIGEAFEALRDKMSAMAVNDTAD